MAKTEKSSLLDQIAPKDVEHQLSRIPLYVRLLSLGKIGIAVVVFGLFALVVIAPFMKSDEDGIRIAITQTPVKPSIEKPVMKNPRYESVDADNHPFTVRAVEAIQQDDERVELHKINADISLDDGLWLALTARLGELNIAKQQLELTEQVQVIANNGYELRSPKVRVDIKQGLASGDQTVSGQGPMGNIRADQFLIEGSSQRVLFEKNVKLVIYP